MKHTIPLLLSATLSMALLPEPAAALGLGRDKQTREWSLADSRCCKYFNLGYFLAKFTNTDKGMMEDYDSYKGEYGVPYELAGEEVKLNGLAFTMGRSFFLKPTPLPDKLRFCVEGTWLNLRWATQQQKGLQGDRLYNNAWPVYWYDYDEEDMERYYERNDEEAAYDYRLHFFNLGVQAGVSVYYQPVEDVNISGYWRFGPTGQVFYLDGSVRYGYASYFNWGFTATWKTVGIYFEGWRGRSTGHIKDIDDDSVDCSMRSHGLSVGVCLHPRFKARL